ncbi:MAG: hypothetical protein E6J66_17740 [Deltaproteobacteria bacterium]|nr:MAG: hypothetical protein E6J66_17740 [Deltaproteobacteria bacterium]
MLAESATSPSLPAFVREWLLPSRTMKRRALPPLIGLGYIALIGILGGLTMDHVVIGSLGLLDLYNEKTRLFLRQFLPFIATGAIYDSMRYFYWPAIANRVHVAGPYQLERSWFGIGGQTPNEWFLTHHWPALDLACGFAYLVFVGEYLAVALLLFFQRRSDMLRTFALAFLVVNLLGFATYFIFPVAPPWYVTEYGLGPARLDVHPAAAAASRFDLLLGTPAIGFFLLMCLSAVYLQHHYVIDVLLGIAYASATLALLGGVPAPAHRSAALASSAQPLASGSPRAAASVARRRACE